ARGAVIGAGLTRRADRPHRRTRGIVADAVALAVVGAALGEEGAVDAVAGVGSAGVAVLAVLAVGASRAGGALAASVGRIADAGVPAARVEGRVVGAELDGLAAAVHAALARLAGLAARAAALAHAVGRVAGLAKLAGDGVANVGGAVAVLAGLGLGALFGRL